MPVTKKHWVEVTPEIRKRALDRAGLAMKRLDNAKGKAERERARKWWAAWMTRTGMQRFPPKGDNQ